MDREELKAEARQRITKTISEIEALAREHFPTSADYVAVMTAVLAGALAAVTEFDLGVRPIPGDAGARLYFEIIDGVNRYKDSIRRADEAEGN